MKKPEEANHSLSKDASIFTERLLVLTEDVLEAALSGQYEAMMIPRTLLSGWPSDPVSSHTRPQCD